MRENHRGVTKYIIRLNSCINLVKYLIKILSSINFHDYELWLLSPCIVSFCELIHKIYILNTENRNKFVFCLFFLITNNKSISPFFPSKYKKSTRSSFLQLQLYTIGIPSATGMHHQAEFRYVMNSLMSVKHLRALASWRGGGKM